MTEMLIAIAAKTQKRFKEVGAVSEETAKTIEELGLPKKWLEIPYVIRTADGRYYLKCKDGKTC